MNRSTRRILLLCVVCFAAGAAFFLWSRRPRSLCADLSCVHLSGSTDYQLKEVYTDTSNVYRALYVSGNRFIRIEAKKNTSSEAQQELAASVITMKSLFEKAPAPYPGDVSDAIVCDPDFVPSYHVINGQNGTIQYFIGYLNSRMTFGSCSQSQAVYKGIMAFMYCPHETETLRVELIAPHHDFESHASSLTSAIQHMTCAK